MEINNLSVVYNRICKTYDYLDFNIKMKKLNKKDRYNLTSDKIQKYSDNFYQFLLFIIEKSDHLIFAGYPLVELKKYTDNILYENYSINPTKDLSYIDKDGYLFDISDQDSKRIIIDNLKYNLEEYEGDEPNYDLFVKVVDIDRDYVANDESFNHSEYMYFLKKDMVIAGFRRRDGTIYDYDNCVEKYIKLERKSKTR